MSALAEPDRTRLVKLLGLLGSDHAGERDAAGLAAIRLLKQHGVTWEDALSPRAVERRLPETGTWRRTVSRILESGRYIRPWERAFLTDLPNFRRLSVKQRYVLTEVAKRVLGEQA